MPVSIDLGRSGATDAMFTMAGIGLTIDSAQARVGASRDAGQRGRRERRTTRRTVARTTPAVRPGYVRPAVAGAVVAGTAVAVGTTVAVLPAQCTTVVVDGVAYRRCGQIYYRSSGGTLRGGELSALRSLPPSIAPRHLTSSGDRKRGCAFDAHVPTNLPNGD